MTLPTIATDEEYYTPREAAKKANQSVRTLEGYRSRGGGPPFIRLGHKTVRYPASLFHRWMMSHLASSTAEEAEAQRRKDSDKSAREADAQRRCARESTAEAAAR